MNSKEGGNDNKHKLIDIHVTFGLLRCLGRDAILSHTRGPEDLGTWDPGTKLVYTVCVYVYIWVSRIASLEYRLAVERTIYF